MEAVDGTLADPEVDLPTAVGEGKVAAQEDIDLVGLDLAEEGMSFCRHREVHRVAEEVESVAHSLSIPEAEDKVDD